MLKDTQAEREQMVKDMANRCKGIIEEAMKWAPDTMRSHLKEYINNKVKNVSSVANIFLLAIFFLPGLDTSLYLLKFRNNLFCEIPACEKNRVSKIF
jgi:hypothetical protein